MCLKRSVCTVVLVLPLVAGNPAQGQSVHKRISYTQDIAPLMLTSCAPCHTSQSLGNYNLTTYGSMVTGGERGAAVVPFRPEMSLLVKTLRGTDDRGERMPPNRKPLTAGEIGMVEEWISQGAAQDRGRIPLEEIRMDVPGITLHPDERDLNVACRSPVRASIRLLVFDQHDRLLTASSWWSVGANAWKWWRGGEKSELKSLFDGSHRARSLRMELAMRFRQGADPAGAVFVVGPADMHTEMQGGIAGNPSEHPYDVIGATPNPALLPPDLTTVFTYWLSRDSDVAVKIWRQGDKAYRLVYRHSERDLSAGTNTYRWNFRGNSGRLVRDGDYVVRLQCQPRTDDYQRRDIVLLYRVNRTKGPLAAAAR